MNSLRADVADYLELRRALGFRLKKDERLLLDFAAFMERRHAAHITAKLAVQWAQQPASTDANYQAGRLRAVRSFARYRILTDPRTEIPATDLLPRHRSTFRPHIFSEDEVGRLLEASLQRRRGAKPISRWSRYAIFGLLSVTGMRVGEVLNLDLEDVDLDNGVLTIRNAKFGKDRLVPVHATTCEALKIYRLHRDEFLAGKVVKPFFISPLGCRITHCVLDLSFLRLTRKLGMRGATDATGPRLHDLRHTMAVEVLRRCYREGADPERRLPALSTYLGHTHLAYTYWYLHQNPSLMTEAVARLEHRWEAAA
ncbi:Mobile element protein [Pseudomonas aeruginosa PA99]|uniref:tyrosine-type recombinase/integrase n=1 Tax=Pseudomonas aeruginosa TaxID=287 RepID=UPI000450B73C|nr:tyrosine-type recombinase/integrase [Pseudomonas aeruginosa]EYU03576.1 Mobile element protein [Pseudomonas aeruginosa PA99]